MRRRRPIGARYPSPLALSPTAPPRSVAVLDVLRDLAPLRAQAAAAEDLEGCEIVAPPAVPVETKILLTEKPSDRPTTGPSRRSRTSPPREG